MTKLTEELKLLKQTGECVCVGVYVYVYVATCMSTPARPLRSGWGVLVKRMHVLVMIIYEDILKDM